MAARRRRRRPGPARQHGHHPLCCSVLHLPPTLVRSIVIRQLEHDRLRPADSAGNGSMMCITTSNTSYMADTIDYELDRSRPLHIPAVVSLVLTVWWTSSSPRWLLSSPRCGALLGFTHHRTPAHGFLHQRHLLDDRLPSSSACPCWGWVHPPDRHVLGCPLTKEEWSASEARHR